MAMKFRQGLVNPNALPGTRDETDGAADRRPVLMSREVV
jgi:hypothetical protein